MWFLSIKSVCVHVCRNVLTCVMHIYVCVLMYVHVFTCVCTHACVCSCMYICVYMCLCVSMYAYMCLHVYVHCVFVCNMFTCVHISVFTCVYTYVHVCTYVFTCVCGHSYRSLRKLQVLSYKMLSTSFWDKVLTWTQHCHLAGQWFPGPSCLMSPVPELKVCAHTQHFRRILGTGLK